MDDDVEPDDHYGIDEEGPVSELQNEDAIVVDPPEMELNREPDNN